MRINDGTNPLDATSVHPESYDAVKELLKKLDMTMDDIKQLQKQVKDSHMQTSKQTGENKKNRRPEKWRDRPIVEDNRAIEMLANILAETKKAAEDDSTEVQPWVM